jgi:uncharacterized protein (TIGR00290 family)
LIDSAISWSGGKDSCLALWRSQKKDIRVTSLITALDEIGLKTRSHGVTRDLIQAQASALGLRTCFLQASWKDYETQFIELLKRLATGEIKTIIFGDIDLVPHREWEEKVCNQAGLIAHLPLWLEKRVDLVDEFLDVGFKARVVCVDGRFLDQSFVGQEFDRHFIKNLPVGVDACGENGEFHTFVYDGPNFSNSVPWQSLGQKTYVSPPEYGSQTYYFDLLDCSHE